MGEFWKIIQVILVSSVKFVAGPFFAYYDNRYDFTFFETVLYCVIGGMLGVIVFTYFSKPIFHFWYSIKRLVKSFFSKEEMFSKPVADIDVPIEVHYEYLDRSAKGRLFTRRNRHIVRVWRKYGLFGVALLTPIILSIPIGTLVANSLVQNRKKIMLYMFVSILFWSLFMTGAFEFFHAVNIRDLRDHLTR